VKDFKTGQYLEYNVFLFMGQNVELSYPVLDHCIITVMALCLANIFFSYCILFMYKMFLIMLLLSILVFHMM